MYTGLDISLTATGIASIDDNGLISSKVLAAPPAKTFTNKFDRYQVLIDKILQAIEDYNTTHVVIEDYIVSRHFETTKKLIEVGACIRYVMNMKKIPFITVAGSQLKKYITGKGNVKKNVVIKELYKKYNIDVNDDNEADAIALAKICKDLVIENPSNPKHMKEVIQKVNKDRERFNW